MVLLFELACIYKKYMVSLYSYIYTSAYILLNFSCDTRPTGHSSEKYKHTMENRDLKRQMGVSSSIGHFSAPMLFAKRFFVAGCLELFGIRASEMLVDVGFLLSANNKNVA
eukprot:GEMP01103133.1.p1 GENE.GEMP01103133.1~~GEMP01103133.1.p1  ORF type:complete len:111 (+),score=0.97 GEMP01103133.1:239-571(+)